MKKILFLALGFLLLPLLTGCAQQIEAAPTLPAVTAGDENQAILAEALVEPAHWSELHFNGSGQVVEILVKPGETVAEGAPLARLDTTYLELTLADAKANVAAQEAALALLNVTRPTTQTAALNVAKARANSAAPDIASSQAALAQADIDLANAQQAYREAKEREYWDPMSLPAYEQALRKAQLARDQAAAQVDRAKQSQSSYSAGVRLEQLQQEQRQAEADQQILQAQARLEQAKIAAERAQKELDDATLKAPFAGTVTDVKIAVGNRISQADVACVLATLDQLEVKTRDLNELSVVKVQEGQEVLVTITALADKKLRGHVRLIDLQAVDFRGEVTYPVHVVLDEELPGLRWGMKATVEIAAP